MVIYWEKSCTFAPDLQTVSYGVLAYWRAEIRPSDLTRVMPA